MSDHMTIIPERLDILDRITLRRGAHNAPEPGTEAAAAMCAMEAAAYIAGEPWSDKPSCVCPVIASFLRTWNDGITDDDTRTRLLVPLVRLSIGTRSTPDARDRRAFMAADWEIRTYTPTWLRLAGLNDHADTLSALPELATIEAFDAARKGPIAAATDAARVAARVAATDAARAAATDAAWDAARDAAWAAARAAAQAAATDAAWTAAWAAAWDATQAAATDVAWTAATDVAWTAAWAAAQDAAQAAATDVAWTAAWTAAQDAAQAAATAAARAAAWAASWAALAPMVAELQVSAVDLVRRMCEVKS